MDLILYREQISSPDGKHTLSSDSSSSKGEINFIFFGMIFSKHTTMKLKISLSILLLCGLMLTAQRSQQRIAYIDMEYILENVPEYLDAQNTLDAKVTKWRGELDKLSRYIEQLKTDLANERAILTQDLIQEKEDEITLKQQELRRLESLYFGPNGDMFLLRKQLVKPVQDQVYNSVQNIATRRNYDFVFDKSSELVMLYSNKKHDISELVLNSIVRDRKIQEKKDAKAKNGGLSDKQKKQLEAKEAARKKKEADREARKKKVEEARKKRLADIEAKRKLLKQKQEEAKKKKEEAKKKKKDNDDKKEEQDNN
jgi:Skp family chaperone for outer membrane proteins